VAKDTCGGQDKLIDIFDCTRRFFQQLEVYVGIKPTAAMMDIIVDIMVEVLKVLAMVTQEVKCGQLSESMLRRFTILDLTDTLG